MAFRNIFSVIQKALTMLIWLVLFCMGLGAASTPLPSEGGISSTVGKEVIKQNSMESNEFAVGSTVGSLGGNVNIMAKEGKYQQTGSDVIALKGDINILAQDITIQEARESTRLFQTMDQSRLGITTGVSSPIISIIQQIERLVDNAEKTDNDRSRALAVGAAGLSIYNNYGSLKESVGLGTGKMAGAQGALASLKFTVSMGSSKSQSQSMEYSQTASSSNVNAAGNVNLVATGKEAQGSTPEVPLKEGGSILIQGSHITGGGDVSLIANKQIDIRAAQNSSFDMGQSKSSSGSISVSYGTQGWGGGVSASKGKGSSIEVDKSWSGSYIDAGGTATLISGGDTNIIGSQVSGDKVQAQIGGDLNIETLQDFSFSHKDEKNSGVSFSTTKGASGSSVGGGVSYSKSNVSGVYLSANEYAGIMAGDGGFDLNVKGNTGLKGGIITSAEAAEKAGQNQLITGTITHTDVFNFSQHKGSGFGFDANVTVSDMGEKSSDPRLGKGIATGMGKVSGKDQSMILSGVYTGNIEITDAEGQKKKTGQSVEEAVSSVQTNITTTMAHNYQGLINDFDANKAFEDLNVQIEITKEFKRNSYQAIDTYTTQQQLKQKEILDDPNATPEEKQAAMDEVYRLEYQRVFLETVTGIAAGSGVTSITKGVLQEAAIAMREESLKNSSLSSGMVDANDPDAPALTNTSETSGWYDGTKLGGVRLDYDAICGRGNSRCLREEDGTLKRNEQGQVVYIGDKDYPTLKSMTTAIANREGPGGGLNAITGGFQPISGRLGPFGYKPGNLFDKIVESFAGTHDYIGGQLPGFYDDEGNTSRGRSWLESKGIGVGAVIAVPVSAPFAISDLVTPELLQLILGGR